MRPTLEIIALNARDARNAEQGGADRLELVGTMSDDGLSPDLATVSAVRQATSLPFRVMLRLRGGFTAHAEDLAQLRTRLGQFIDAGADGVVLGFLDEDGAVDATAVHALVDDGSFAWTFHRAIDHVSDADAAWAALRDLPRLDQVLSAGSPDGVGLGLADLLGRAGADPFARDTLMVGGGLAPAHIGPLLGAGVRSFHVGSPVRPGGSFAAPVQVALVELWRDLLDEQAELPAAAAASSSASA